MITYEYEAYGVITAIKNAQGYNIMYGGGYDTSVLQLNPFRYRGYMFDPESEFYYLNSRYYDPWTSRFLNADALVSTGQGVDGYNAFTYCNCNPVVFSDHSGTEPTYTSIMEEYFRIRDGIVSGDPAYAKYNMKTLNMLSRTADKYAIVSSVQISAAGFEDMSKSHMYDLNITLINNGITSANLISHFLAQCAVESNKGKWLTELGDESYFANTAYGYKYRGAGYIHVTWDYNYLSFAESVGDMEIYNQGADYVAEHYPWRASGWWWSKNNMNSKIISGYSVNDVSQAVLGGYNKTFGIRSQYYYEYLGIFG